MQHQKNNNRGSRKAFMSCGFGTVGSSRFGVYRGSCGAEINSRDVRSARERKEGISEYHRGLNN